MEASMQVMLKLPTAALPRLRHIFSQKPDGLSLHEFIDAMLQHLPREDEQGTLQLVADMTDMFKNVDINGDGAMDWDEFTAFVVESGMVSDKSAASQEQKYVEDTSFECAARLPRHLKYMPALRWLAVCESENSVVRFYDPHQMGGEVGAAMPQVASARPCGGTKSMTGEKEDIPVTTRTHVLDIEYLDGLDTFAVAVNDLTISFWHKDKLLHGKGGKPLRIYSSDGVDTSQRMLRWDAQHQTLYSCGMRPHVTCWHVVRESPEATATGRGELKVKRRGTISGHSDTIADMLVVPGDPASGTQGFFVTGGLDSRILLWALGNDELKGERKGHRCGGGGGVQSMSLGAEALLFSSSFEYEIFGWDISGMNERPLFRLLGHRAPLFGVQAVPDTEFAISVDASGVFRWWDMRRGAAIEDSERCIGVFRAAPPSSSDGSITTISSLKPTAICVVPETHDIMVAAGPQLHRFALVRLKSTEAISVCALSNSADCEILTTADRDVRVWSSQTGRLVRTYYNISDYEITAVTFDDRKRKFIVANQKGEVNIFAFMNGRLMRKLAPHSQEVSCVSYCAENKCVLTASWDRSIRVYNDTDPDANEPTREVINAHAADISTLAFSHSLSLIASGAQDGSLKLWDFSFFAHDGTCRRLPDAGEITAMTFVHPYPLLVTADVDNMMSLWPVRPFWGHGTEFRRYSAALHVLNMVDLSTVEPPFPAPITAMQSFYDATGGDEIAPGVNRGRHMLVTGDEYGFIRLWDLTPALKKMGMQALRDEEMPCNFVNFNAHRRCKKDGFIHSCEVEEADLVEVNNDRTLERKEWYVEYLQKKLETARHKAETKFEADASEKRYDKEEELRKRDADEEDREFTLTALAKELDAEREALQERFSSQLAQVDEAVASLEAHPRWKEGKLSRADVPCLREWRAHTGVIHNIEWNDNPDDGEPFLLTTGADKKTFIWSADGCMQGEMSNGSSLHVEQWRFSLDLDIRQRNRIAVASQTLSAMAAAEEAAKVEAEEQKRKAALRPAGANVAVSPVTVARSPAAGTASSAGSPGRARLGRTKVAGPPAEERERLFGQIGGKTTWVRSAFEIAQDSAKQKEAERRQREQRRKRKQARRKKKQGDPFGFGASKQSSGEDPTLALLEDDKDDDMAATDAIPSQQKSQQLNQKHLDAEDNWSMGSANRQREMYVNQHAELTRVEKTLAARKSKRQSVAPSEFLRKHLDHAEGRNRAHAARAAKAKRVFSGATKSPAAEIDAFIREQQQVIADAFTKSYAVGASEVADLAKVDTVRQHEAHDGILSSDA